MSGNPGVSIVRGFLGLIYSGKKNLMNISFNEFELVKSIEVYIFSLNP